MTEKTIFRQFIELAMACQTNHTKNIFKQLTSTPATPVSIIAILHLRDNYNNFMNDCNKMLEAEKLYRQIKYN